MLSRGDISLESIYAYAGKQQSLHQKKLDQLGEQMRDWIGTDVYGRLSPRFHLSKGPAKMMIAILAEGLRADLVVMGTIARTGISGHPKV